MYIRTQRTQISIKRGVSQFRSVRMRTPKSGENGDFFLKYVGFLICSCGLLHVTAVAFGIDSLG